MECRPSDSSSDEDGTDTEDEGTPKRRQVYFCSRTHSQLSQFVSELHRTPFAASFSVATVASRKVRIPVLLFSLLSILFCSTLLEKCDGASLAHM